MKFGSSMVVQGNTSVKLWYIVAKIIGPIMTIRSKFRINSTNPRATM